MKRNLKERMKERKKERKRMTFSVKVKSVSIEKIVEFYARFAIAIQPN